MSELNKRIAYKLPDASEDVVLIYSDNINKKYIQSIVVCNISSSIQTFKLWISNSDVENDNISWIFYDYEIEANDTEIINLNLQLNNKEYLIVNTSGDLNFTVIGDE